MKRLQRITAFLLCIIMMFPAQAMPVFADTLSPESSLEGFSETEEELIEEELTEEETERISEILPLEELAEEETDRINVTLPLDELPEESEHISEILPLDELTEEADHINETLPLEELTEGETNHISETLPLETLDGSGTLAGEALELEDEYEDGVIYWNPGGTLPEELEADSDVSIATDSDAEKASPSSARRGSDSASGRSAKAPVKSLKTALKRAEQLQEEGFDPSEITIYAMNPMEIADGQLYVLNTSGVNITSWPERAYDSDAIFYVNGGQLTIMNLSLESGNPEQDPELAELIYVKGGTLQIGENVSVNGRIVMDYRNEIEGLELEEMITEANVTDSASAQTEETTAETESSFDVRLRKTDSDTTGVEYFDIDDYTIETEEETLQLIRDTKSASTWREPVIELMDGFGGSSGSYLLDVRGDDSTKHVELVKTLYADEYSEEEFMELFCLAETDEEIWSLSAASEVEAEVRDTDAGVSFFSAAMDEGAGEEEESEELVSSEVMTRKTLIATKDSTAQTIYWNPGGAFRFDGKDWVEGDDSRDGRKDFAPVKTWEVASALAGTGGTVICQQSLTLNGGKEYLNCEDGIYTLGFETKNPDNRITLKTWELNPQPVIIVEKGQTLVLDHIILGGAGDKNSVPVIKVEQGDLIIGNKVKAESGFIEIEAFTDMENHPVEVKNSGDTETITLFFSGINKDISYRYKDVVIPYNSDDIENKDEFGRYLLSRFQLHPMNSRDFNEGGGGSMYDWQLRQDTNEDNPDGDPNPENLELYTKYYYDAVYLNGITGKDTYYGTDCEYPVKTWERAREIWEQAMREGVKARKDAFNENMPDEMINERYPIPEIIYICDTVTVDKTATWKLECKDENGQPLKDYNGESIETEIISHVTDIPNKGETEEAVHELPQSLISVEKDVILTIENLVIRNTSDVENSNTINVNEDGTLIFKGSTTLSGELRQSDGSQTAGEYTTHGDHVVISDGTFKMGSEAEPWTGSIETGQRGIVASGAKARVEMNGGSNDASIRGSIRNNNSFDQKIYDEGKTNHPVGSGVVLTDGATFIMNGGSIENNTVYQYGAGVYLDGQGTEFIMNQGIISGNKMAGRYEHASTTSLHVAGAGIGIYSGTDTKTVIGSAGAGEESAALTAKIIGNHGYFVKGAGIYSEGTELTITNAEIKDNFTDGASKDYISYGIGVCVNHKGLKFSMKDSAVIGNYSLINYVENIYGDAFGAGIYLLSSNEDNIIESCTITENGVGRQASVFTSHGGGIYVSGVLKICHDTIISHNRATDGGGIYSEASTLYIADTEIYLNTASAYNTNFGSGGGIYQNGGTMTLEGQTCVGKKSIDDERNYGNFAMQYGGGIFNYNGTLIITGTETNYIQISCNRTQYGYAYGSGIASYSVAATTAKIHIKYADIFNNYCNGYFGAGIYSAGLLTVEKSKIHKNETNLSHTSDGGGGIFCRNKATIIDSEIIGNSTNGYGGGIRSEGELTIENCQIKENKANKSGGGIYTNGRKVEIFNTAIESNTTAASGGGFYMNEAAAGYCYGSKINNNKALNGGGISLSASTCYLTDVELTDNTASESGGGVYLEKADKLSKLYFTETKEGNSALFSNTAKSGGGIYTNTGSIYMDISGSIQNTASEQGSNLYLTHTGNWILDGEYKQPEHLADGVYNVYMNILSNDTSNPLYLDPQKVNIKPKEDTAHRDAIYLETGSSFLTYLRAPLENKSKEFPIDVNEKNFKVGSIVIKPANGKTETFYKVKLNAEMNKIDGYESKLISYGDFVNASENLEYSKGGKLPRRMNLAGFSQKSSTLINAVLIGEGVYLSGSGDDNKSGDSPSEAVATFKKAKERLQIKIEDNRDTKEGYSPFIYICGSVNIENDGETWSLDYDDKAAFSSEEGGINHNYRITEEDFGAIAYDAQVRRFASFVNAPMISVESGKFITEKIIINGMMEAVVASDQDKKSPIIEIETGSEALLNGNTRITNNYYGGINVKSGGILNLHGEKKDDENKQLLNHGGYYVQLGADAKLNMTGYARIIAEGEVKRQGTRDLIGVYSDKESSKAVVTMSGNSSIVYKQSDNPSYANGEEALLRAGIQLLGPNSEVSMTEEASMENLSGGTIPASGIEVGTSGNITMAGNSFMKDFTDGYAISAGNSATVTITDNVVITSKSEGSSNGVYLDAEAMLTMLGKAAIIDAYYGIKLGRSAAANLYSEARLENVNYGINTSGSYTSTHLHDDTKITSPKYGAELTETNATVHLSENASIKVVNTDVKIDNSIGIYTNSANTTICMEGLSNITEFKSGVYFDKNSSGSLEMNSGESESKNTDGSAAAIIKNSSDSVYAGVTVLAGSGVSISMGGKASIDGTDSMYGIYYSDGTVSTNENNSKKITMTGASRITGCKNTAIFLDMCRTLFDLKMTGSAAIEGNVNGVCEYQKTSTLGARYVTISMSDDTRISGNSQRGISFAGYNSHKTEEYIRINLSGNAMIGGEQMYDPDDLTSGNGYSGICTSAPIQLDMSGKSGIKGNGGKADENSEDFYGIYAKRITGDSKYYRTGTGKINLSGEASICKNAGAIFLTKGTAEYPNPFEVTLEGSASIYNNSYPVYMKGADQKIELKGSARIGASQELKADKFMALDTYGPLFLDGNSTIDGLIYLRTGSLPITMTALVPEGSPKNRYSLWLSEEFLGTKVVQPEDIMATEAGKTKDVSTQLEYFEKVGADGMAESKKLVALDKYIVLQGGKNVYLSGQGNDTNTGQTPEVPVRTFKRAKEILEKEDIMTDANVMICAPVTVEKGDTEWSFGSDGTVTNVRSNESWVPKLLRYEQNMSQLIKLEHDAEGKYASEVNFKNIIVDGGSEDGIKLTKFDCELLVVGAGTTANLGEGAVFQNNEVVPISAATGPNNTAIGITVNSGTLEINGGSIKNMVRGTMDIKYYGTKFYGASAISCIGTAKDPGKVIMKSGQIINNKLDVTDLSHADNFLGTIYLGNEFAEMKLSGGIIKDNQVIADKNLKTGTILLNKGSMTMEGGTIQQNQTSYVGSAIYYHGGTGQAAGDYLIISGGQISDNTTSDAAKPQGADSPLYIAGKGFQLKGGRANINDNIYLSGTEHLITVSDRIYQYGRKYNIFLNKGNGSTQFKKGSAVIQPDAVYVTDATPYMPYFEVHSYPYVLDIGRQDKTTGTNPGVKENQCLILMKAVYLNSENTNAVLDGTTPETAVTTFADAKIKGEEGEGLKDYYIIYISGPAFNTQADTWELPAEAYMCRYTGFPIYTSDESILQKTAAYHGVLIEPKAELTLSNITIYGRRSIDNPTDNNGESLLIINAGKKVTMLEGTVLQRNYNNGTYIPEGQKIPEWLSTTGGAVYVAPNGTLDIRGGVIQETDAPYGSGIYLNPDGHLILSGSPVIDGKVYLGGESNTSAAFIEPKEDYKPEKALNITIANDFDERQVIKYPTGVTPDMNHMDYYAFEDAITALYTIDSDSGEGNIFKLYMRHVYYLDGYEGNDDNNGKTPDTALLTLEALYKNVKEDTNVKGVVVYVVNTVKINSGQNIMLTNVENRKDDKNYFEGSYAELDAKDNIVLSHNVNGQIYFKRYSQPKDGDAEYDDFEKGTLFDTLFRVYEGGKLTLNGIYIDGHSVESVGSNPLYVADAVEATSPLVVVEGGASLICSFVTGADTRGTRTVFANNLNKNKETKPLIGYINGAKVYGGSSAGIEILSSGSGEDEKMGIVHLAGTQFNNLALGEGIKGGTDIYSNGTLKLKIETFFTGSVLLEGVGNEKEEDTHDTSRYLTIESYGDYLKTGFNLLMTDTYPGRKVVQYNAIDKPTLERDIVRFLLEERIKDYFCLDIRAGEDNRHILELQVPAAVYVNGATGNDSLADDSAGSNPLHAVQSLERAYKLLSTRGGNTIYVVDTIQLKGDIIATGNSLKSSIAAPVHLVSTDRVKIVRYVQPDFARNASTSEDIQDAVNRGYNLPDFEGPLLNVNSKYTAEFSNGIYFDGHHEKKEPTTERSYRREEIVSKETDSKSPMITVEKDAELYLNEGTVLQDNYNTYGKEEADTGGSYGGAIYNSGTTTVDGAYLVNNKAAKGAVVYQDGIFTIKSAPEKLNNLLKPEVADGEPQANADFYLTTTKDGDDHVIRLEAKMPEDPEKLKFHVDMDNAVRGRDVIEFLSDLAYDGSADAEHDHFKLSHNVPSELFLVEDENNSNILELQDWNVLNVEVPSDIYLVMHQRGESKLTTRLKGIRLDASEDELFSSPEYTITNKGNYDVKVSVTAFDDVSTEAGIADEYSMKLVNTQNDILEVNELYLAVKGLDEAADHGFLFDETSLAPYAAAGENRLEAIEFGKLNRNGKGTFAFHGVVGEGFMEKYADQQFPLVNGSEKEDVQKYIEGKSADSTGVKARAKYAMRFRLEIDPPRRESTETSINP